MISSIRKIATKVKGIYKRTYTGLFPALSGRARGIRPLNISGIISIGASGSCRFYDMSCLGTSGAQIMSTSPGGTNIMTNFELIGGETITQINDAITAATVTVDWTIVCTATDECNEFTCTVTSPVGTLYNGQAIVISGLSADVNIISGGV